ncbi:MAG TPA: VCBS repeat-containing protein, partial [Bacteroidota bacterium]
MKKSIFLFAPLSFLLSCGQLFSQEQESKGVTKSDYDRLESIIRPIFGEALVSGVVNPDSAYPNMFPTLSGCLVFGAYPRSLDAAPPFVGVSRGDQILWKSENEIDFFLRPGIGQIIDLNKDGKPELFVLSEGGVSGVGYELWIYDWDGTNGTRVNPVEDGRSRMGYLDDPDAYQFVDTNGDGVMEIRLLNVENETRYFYWDGFQYLEGTPVPFTVLPRNRLSIEFKTTVEKIDQALHYRYSILNQSTSQQAADDLLLEPAAGLQITAIAGRSQWKAASGPSFVRWSNLYFFGERNYISPGEKDTSFSIQRQSLPQIAKYYVQGHNGDEFSGTGIQSNSASGFAVTPNDPPSPFMPESFLDTLLSYTTQSRSLGWITNQSTAEKYTGYFTLAKSSLQADNINSARATLQQVLNDVNVDSSSTLTSEAYALLRFNTEYLLSQLPEQESGISTYSLFA